MISKRIKLVAEYINDGDVIIDVGCDHGYLGLLGLDKNCKYVEFVDNKSGPLNICKDNIEPKRFNKERYAFNLSDGLTSPLLKEYDKCFILGMGGSLICDIISSSKANINTFILGANNNVLELRKYLFDNHYQITDEKVIFDKDKYYEIIVCSKIKNSISYDDYDLMFGPVLKVTKPIDFINKWTSIYQKNKDIINSSEIEITNLIKMNKMIEEVLCIK